MKETVFNKEMFTFYGVKSDQLVPLYKWDHIDDRGAHRGKSPRDKDWRNKKYEFNDISIAVDSGSNLGFRLSNKDLVVDMDPRNMEISLEEAVKYLVKTYNFPELVDAPTVITGSGGLHIYLQIPSAKVGKKLKNGLNDLPGVEFKGLGRQVVAVGSKHPNGEMYVLEPSSPTMEAVVECPESLIADLIRPIPTVSESDRDLTCEELAECLACLDPTDFSDHDKWVQLAMACHSATGGEGIEEFVEWSIQDEEYSDQSEVIRDRWVSFTSSGITARTLFKAVSDAGHPEVLRESAQKVFGAADLSEQDKKLIETVPDKTTLFDRAKSGEPKRTVDNTKKAIKALGIVPSRNAFNNENFITGDREILRKYFPNVLDSVDDDLLHGIRAAITREYDFEPSLTQASEALSALALLNQWHPIREYLDGLQWDGVDRISTFFTRYCGTELTPYSSEVAKLLLRACVARVTQPGIKYDTMVILEGRQGCGKSSLVSILGGEWALEGLPNKSDLNNKDVIQQIQGHWIIEVEELAVMRKSDVDSMKAFLTRTTDKARFAYAREAKEYPRQCVFIGTTNDDEYLLDSTGNRRFLPIEVEHIDLPGLIEDRNQIWAQASHQWKMNPSEKELILPEYLWEVAEREQAMRRVADPLEFKLEEYLSNVDEEIDFIAQSDIISPVLGKASSDMSMYDMRRISRAIYSVDGWRSGRKLEGDMQLKGFVRTTKR